MLRLLLWKTLRSNSIIIVSSAISFVIGLLLSTVIQQLLTSQANLLDLAIQGAIFLVLILLLVFLSFQFTSIQAMIRRHKLAVNVSYASAKQQDAQLYAPVNLALTSAQRSIRVIGMFRASDLPPKTGRKGYYDILEEAVELKLQLNQPFIYERIVQVKTLTPGVLCSKDTDPVTFEHCKRVLEWKKQRSAVSADVKQIPDILGGLSFLLIDDDKFVMVIPDITRKDSGELRLEGLRLGLTFEDPDGMLTEPMKSFFARLFNEADIVSRLVEPEPIAEGQTTTTEQHRLTSRP